MLSNSSIPVITIDGPGGTGKGTVSMMLAKYLGWHFLDSGALYRAVSWAILYDQIDFKVETDLKKMLSELHIVFENEQDGCPTRILCNGLDITLEIRSEDSGMMASKISAIPSVRQALLQYQRDFRRSPGLVTDGRDMGSIVFPDASWKFFLTASLEERAMRRFRQLQEKGINVNLREIQAGLEIRDQQDQHRKISPTRPAPDAVIIDTTTLSVNEVFSEILKHLK